MSQEERLRDLESHFWEAVRNALSILDADTVLADDYRARLKNAPSAERLLALHEDPIDVAATLAGISLTDAQLQNYRPRGEMGRHTGLKIP